MNISGPTKLPGYRYCCGEEAIRRYMALPAQQKLLWLADLNAFLHKTLPSEAKSLQARFRKGDI